MMLAHFHLQGFIMVTGLDISSLSSPGSVLSIPSDLSILKLPSFFFTSPLCMYNVFSSGISLHSILGIVRSVAPVNIEQINHLTHLPFLYRWWLILITVYYYRYISQVWMISFYS